VSSASLFAIRALTGDQEGRIHGVCCSALLQGPSPVRVSRETDAQSSSTRHSSRMYSGNVVIVFELGTTFTVPLCDGKPLSVQRSN